MDNNIDTLRDAFEKLFMRIATSDDIDKEDDNGNSIYDDIENLYYNQNGEKIFRHFYSDIFTLLVKLKKDKENNRIELLMFNLEIMMTSYDPKNDSKNDVSDIINKLYDHSNLELARIGYAETQNSQALNEDVVNGLKKAIKKLDNKVECANNTYTDFSNDMSDMKKEYLAISNDMSDMKREYIAILGIFAAVTLSFTAGITFSSSVLENFHLSSIYRVITVITLLGIVMTNMLYGLFYYMEILVRNKEEAKIKPMVICNLVFTVILIATFGAWCCIENKTDIAENISDETIVEVPLELEVDLSASSSPTSKDSI